MTPDETFLNQTRYHLFNTTAPRYEPLIMPAFGPLAARLVEAAQLQPHERVLDLGTGTGAVGLPAGQVARQVVGLDYAPAMLAIAQRNTLKAQAQNVGFYQGDMHRLPHPANTFAVALASFGFNGVDPERVFREVKRVLQAGGRLVFQEWGEVEEASKIVKQAIKAHKVERAEGFLADLRRLSETLTAWDELNDEEDIARLLGRAGFGEVKILIEREAIPFEPGPFYHYKTAWAPYQAELAAMPDAERTAVETEVVARLSAWAGPDGRFTWKPELVRIIAWT